MSSGMERRAHVLQVARDDLRFQFGQPFATRKRADEGAACGVATIQLLVSIWKGKKITMDEILDKLDIDRLSGRGLRYSEMVKALRLFGLKYEVLTPPAATALSVRRAARDKGPVVFVGWYPAFPQWQGYRYRGQTADGKP